MSTEYNIIVCPRPPGPQPPSIINERLFCLFTTFMNPHQHHRLPQVHSPCRPVSFDICTEDMCVPHCGIIQKNHVILKVVLYLFILSSSFQNCGIINSHMTRVYRLLVLAATQALLITLTLFAELPHLLAECFTHRYFNVPPLPHYTWLFPNLQ